jgi:hypothetical protein
MAWHDIRCLFIRCVCTLPNTQVPFGTLSLPCVANVSTCSLRAAKGSAAQDQNQLQRCPSIHPSVTQILPGPPPVTYLP